MGINVEWIINKAKEKIYAVSHAKAVIRGDHTIDEDLTNLENTMKNHSHDERYYTESEVDTRLDDKIDKSLRGIAGGIAELDDTGRIPSAQLPSYVDDVLEYTSISVFPTTGEEGKIYVDKTTNLTYRWSGTDYVSISQSLALGETSSTAYAGDKGKNLATNLSSHVNNTDIHVTSEEKESWNSKADLSDIPTTLPANGGNADTVGGKNMAELMALGMNYADRTKISEGDLNNYTNAGRFVVTTSEQASAISNSPFTSSGYYLDVYHRATGYYAQIAMNWRGLVKIRSCIDSTWGEWKNISDDGNADTVDSKHASDFMQNLGTLTTGSLLDYVLTMTNSGYLLVKSGVTDTPVSGQFFFVDVRRETGGSYAITAIRYNAGGVWTNRYNNNSNMRKWYGWANVADGGNANTLDGLHASDITLSYVRKYKPTVTSVVLLDSAVKLKWLPVDNATKYAVSLYNGRDYTTYSLDITSTEYTITGLSNGTEYQFLVQAYVNGKWNSFDKSDHIAVRLPSLATDTVAGLVSTGTQQFAGYKIFPTKIAIKTTGTVGTQPASDINSAVDFTNPEVNAQFGGVKNCIRGTSHTTGEVFMSMFAFSNDRTGSNDIKVVATNNNSGNYVSIGNPTVASSVSCLRKLASGTASANKTNCPSGSWYGKHS